MKYFGLVSIVILFISCGEGFQIVKNVYSEDGKDFQYGTTPLLIKHNTQSFAYDIYADFSYEQKESKGEYTFGIKFVGPAIPVINSIAMEINGEDKYYPMKKYPLRKLEGVKGVTEKVYYVVSEDDVFDILLEGNCSLTFEGEGNGKYEISLNEIGVNALTQLYEEVNKAKKTKK